MVVNTSDVSNVSVNATLNKPMTTIAPREDTMVSSSSSFETSSPSLRQLARRAVSVTVTIENTVDEAINTTIKNGTSICGHRKHCSSKGHHHGNVREFSSTPSLDLSGEGSSSPNWVPFIAWFIGLIIVLLITAVLVYRFLRKRDARDEYEELHDAPTAAVPVDRGVLHSGGNSSRQRFLESRRAAAQKSYDTDRPSM